MSKKKVFVSGKLHAGAMAALQGHPQLDVVYRPDLARGELLESIGDTQILVTRSETTIDAELFAAAPTLETIVRAAVGVGNIDCDLATEKGILVINCPGKNTNSAAELTFGLLLAMLRQITGADASLRAGKWNRHLFTGEELRGLTLGICGLGNVGRRMAQFANAFEMDVFAYDPYLSPQAFREARVQRVDSLDQLVRQVRILSPHVPLNGETRGMISREIIQSLRPGGFIINTSRGGVIDEQAVIEALNSDHLAGAAIDTWQDEPKPSADLVRHPKVVGTPHIGASTIQAQEIIGRTVVEQISKCLAGSVVDYPVNMPDNAIGDDPLIRAYAILAEKIGRSMAQMLSFNPAGVAIYYRGDLAESNRGKLVRLGWMKGFCADRTDNYVTYVNCEQIFNSMRITLSEQADPQFSDYRSALKVSVRSDDGEELVVGGTVFDATELRISLIQSYPFEFKPDGKFLVIRNQDKPGVIGELGSFLASRGINIDSFFLSRNQPGGTAMAVVKIDADDVTELVTDARRISHVEQAWLLDL